jgi:membrane peptidoglycan carboxypeptidase
MRDTTAYLLIDSMKDTVISGTGTAMNWIGNPQMRRDIPVAGKTGTTNDSRDLGFSGFTPYLTASIWFGNDDNVGMSTTTHRGMGPARLFHGPLWRNIMQEIHEWERFEPREFERPPGIITEVICRDSGHLATELCRVDPRGNRTRSEIFARGTVPTAHCTVHQEHIICTEHGHLAGPDCTNTEARVLLVRTVPIPEEYDNVIIRDRAYEHHPSVRAGVPCTLCDGWGGTWNDPWGDIDVWDWPSWMFPWGQNQPPDDDSGNDGDDGDPVYDVPDTTPPPGAPDADYPGDDNDNGEGGADDGDDDSPPPGGLWGN